MKVCEYIDWYHFKELLIYFISIQTFKGQKQLFQLLCITHNENFGQDTFLLQQASNNILLAVQKKNETSCRD